MRDRGKDLEELKGNRGKKVEIKLREMSPREARKRTPDSLRRVATASYIRVPNLVIQSAMAS